MLGALAISGEGGSNRRARGVRGCAGVGGCEGDTRESLVRSPGPTAVACAASPACTPGGWGGVAVYVDEGVAGAPCEVGCVVLGMGDAELFASKLDIGTPVDARHAHSPG